MGLFDTLRKASGTFADNTARRTDELLDKAERQAGGRMSQEQQNKIDSLRNDAQRGREYAAEQKNKRNG